MSTSMKRPIESIDSPQSPEDRNGSRQGAIEPELSFETGSSLSDTFKLWQSDTLHGTSKLGSYPDDSFRAEFNPSTDLSSIGDYGDGVGASDSSVNFEANNLPPMFSPEMPLEAMAPLPGVISVEGKKFTEEVLAGDQGIKPKVDGVRVCYGMIHKARLKVLDITSILHDNVVTNTPSTDFYSLHLKDRNRNFFLKSDISDGLAVLNDETTAALQGLSDFPNCYFRTYISQDQWKELVQSGGKNHKIIYILVDIVLYGSHENRNAVGQKLSCARIYLQHPYHQEANTLYDNPHVLKFDDFEPTLRLSNTQTPLAAVQESSPVGQSITDFQRDDNSPAAQISRKIATVFNSLTRSMNLKRIEADLRIRTPLRPHQEEALDFMAQREVGPIPGEYSLWSCESHELGTFYEHKIVGTRASQRPSETGGGILADEMGLGKTLTTISTIIRTADNAKAFAVSKGDFGDATAENLDSSQHLASRSTLVVCPSPLLLQGWLDEIQMHCDGFLSVNIYHGRGRDTDRTELANSDIVLSTYHTIAAEALDNKSPLYQIKWFRIVLDEAHIIRHMSTKLFRAVAKLPGNFRWCLTGTPVQNSLDDLAALMAFIRTSSLDNPHEFRKYIITPLIRNTGIGPEGLRHLLDSVCLRRTKKLLQLPEETYERREVEFSYCERAHYDAVEREMAKAVKQHDGHTRNSKGYFGVFQLQLQLRRLCNHGTFQKASLKVPVEEIPFDPEEALAHLQKTGNDKCVYCDAQVTGLSGIEDFCTGQFTLCGHLLCSECIPRYKEAVRQVDGGLECSLCQKKVTADYFLTKKMIARFSAHCRLSAKEYFEQSGTSSKISALIKDIQQNLYGVKSIVFSGWTRSLDLLEKYLNERGVSFVRMDGSYPLRQRQEVLRTFNSDSSIPILMMTTGTGGTGLNITVANIVYILEPQWNPKVEDQAIARVLRLGQTREVKVIRYIIKGTVEELMTSQQIRKLEFAKAGWRDEC